MLHQSSPILAAAASSAFLAKGCVNVLELSMLKEQAADRWPRVREGVYAFLETQLRNRLGPNDLFVRLGDSAYLITMPSSEPEDVSAICLRVAFDLFKSFLGECDLDWIQVNNVISSDDENLVLKRLPIEKMVVLAKKVGIDHDKSGPIVSRTQAMPPMPATPPPPPPSCDIGLEMRPVDTVRRSRQQALPAHMDTYTPPRTELHYVPVWAVPNAAVTSYACEAKSITVAGRPGRIALSQLSAQERLSVEMSAFQTAVEQLGKSATAGVRYLLVVPFSFEALASPNGRMEIQSACRALRREMRPFLTFMLYDVPPGIPQTRLANLVTILNPFGRGVIATVAPSRRTWPIYQGIGLSSVGFDLAEFQAPQTFRPYDAEELSQFARRSNLGTFLWNIGSKDVLKYAQDAGIQMLSGPAILPPCAEPTGMQRLRWSEVLAKPETEIWI